MKGSNYSLPRGLITKSPDFSDQTEDGHSHHINGSVSRCYVHLLHLTRKEKKKGCQLPTPPRSPLLQHWQRSVALLFGGDRMAFSSFIKARERSRVEGRKEKKRQRGTHEQREREKIERTRRNGGKTRTEEDQRTKSKPRESEDELKDERLRVFVYVVASAFCLKRRCNNVW